MGAWTEIARARLSGIRKDWWNAHKDARIARSALLRERWAEKRAAGGGRGWPRIKPKKDHPAVSVDELCRRRGVMPPVEPRLRKLDLWPKSFAELSKRDRP